MVILIYFFCFTAQDISTFTTYFRERFSQATFPVKLYMLEDHVFSFIQEWHFPLGFFDREAGESIHYEFVDLAAIFTRVHPATERLKRITMLEEHFVVVHPETERSFPENRDVEI